MLRGLSSHQRLYHSSPGIFLMVIILWAIGGDRWLPLLSRTGEDAAEASVTIEMVTDPPREQTLSDSMPAQLTFKASVDGKPLSSGHLAVDVTAPPTPMLLPTPLPAVEGTTLLQLSSELRSGTFAMEYLFPINGIYTFNFDITPGSDGLAMQPTTIHHSMHVQADPASVHRVWLISILLFSLGGIPGAWYAYAAHRQKRSSSRAVIAPGVLVLGGLVLITGTLTFAHHGPGVLVFPKGPQLIQGDDGWALEVRPTPVQAVIGELLELNVMLTHEGKVFSGAIEVAMHLYNLQDDQTVLRTSVLAPNGSTSQRVQLVDNALHTCSMTVRPLSGGSDTPATLPSLTSVIGIDVVAAPIPFSLRLRVVGLALGMVGAGVAGGFLLASGVRKLPGRSER